MLKAVLLSVSVFLTANSSCLAGIIFQEDFGTSGANTPIAIYGGYSNGVGLTFSGTGDVRSTGASNVYSGATGGSNVFLTNNGTSTLQIGGINTLGYDPGSFELTFGAFKNTTASDLTDLIVSYSTDNIVFTNVTPTFPAQSIGSGTTGWRLLTITPSSLPVSNTLSLRFTNTSTSNQVRLDDITLRGTLSPTAVPEPSSFAFLALAGVSGLGAMRRRRNQKSLEAP